MPKRMNNEARPRSWQVKAARLLQKIWSVHSEGYVFLGTLPGGTRLGWQDHPLRLPVDEAQVIWLLHTYDRRTHEIYFCANAFGESSRTRENALWTPYACVDVDDADLAAFKPQPTLSWETSPYRTQAIWAFREALSPEHAEQISRRLAYEYGADKNGWSVTKHLRVPYTYNHKPEYDGPKVRLLHNHLSRLPHVAPSYEPEERNKRRRPDQARRSDTEYLKPLPTGDGARKAILGRYGARLGFMPRVLLGHRTVQYTDRSGAIYAIVAALHEVGAPRDDIEVALWNSVYFRDKHGPDRWALDDEITRILEKLEDWDDDV